MNGMKTLLGGPQVAGNVWARSPLWGSDAPGKSTGAATRLLLLARPREEYRVPNRYSRHWSIAADGQKQGERSLTVVGTNVSVSLRCKVDCLVF